MSSLGISGIRHFNWWWGVPLAMAVYLGITTIAGRLGLEHVALAGGVTALALCGRRTRAVVVEAAPFLVFLFGYDLFRYPRAALITSDRVLGCELRALELRLFPANQWQTWPEYFTSHNAPWFDIIAAIPYTAFVFVVVGYAAFLYHHDKSRMRRFLWAFTIGNFAAFVIWLLLPTAPPWYLHAHGCGIDAAALPSAAGLERVDSLLGASYFHDAYSNSAMVFGAVPSLHCAYPMMGLFTAWPYASWKTKPLHLIYAALMAVSAVYLNHHWILDVAAGWLVALFSVWASTQLLAAVSSESVEEQPPAPSGFPA